MQAGASECSASNQCDWAGLRRLHGNTTALGHNMLVDSCSACPHCSSMNNKQLDIAHQTGHKTACTNTSTQLGSPTVQVVTHACCMQHVRRTCSFYRLSMPYLMQAQARRAGSQLYRVGAVMVELSRAASALVAALDGNPAPLALNASQYIRPDGRCFKANPGSMGFCSAQPHVCLHGSQVRLQSCIFACMKAGGSSRYHPQILPHGHAALTASSIAP